MKNSFVDTFASQTMNLDLSKTIGAPKNVPGLCTDLFLIVIRMRESEDLGEPEALKKLIRYYLDLFKKNCAMISIPEEQISDAQYALVALIDETVLSIPGPCRDFWLSRPLQLDFFGHNIAGEEFYRKLDKLLLAFEKNREILEIYYLCLSLGFEGKYKLTNAQARAEVMEELGIRLKKTMLKVSSELSPHAFRGASLNRKPKRKIAVPLWAAGVVGAAVSALWYIILFVNNSAQVSNIVEQIRPLAR
ncbi:MAG: hypothetical protein GF350_16565 [Chitinivibrionales bacterium]|nr:hypothetical protein [Chitinivibrionales bacterium]